MCPLSPLPPSPPLLLMFPFPLPPRICRACCLGAGSLLLGGPPRSGELTMPATIALAYSSGVTLPPIRGNETSVTPGPARASSTSPSVPLRLTVWGLCRSWGQVLGSAPHLMYQAVHEGRALLLGGFPPLPFLVRFFPHLPPLLNTVRGERTLLGGCLLFGFLVRGPSPLLLLHDVQL